MAYRTAYEDGRFVLGDGRVTLREHTPEDAAVLADGKPGELRWIDGVPGEGSIGAAGTTVRASIAGQYRSPWGIFAILRAEDGVALGSIGFHGPPSPAGGEVEVGYDLSRSARRVGWATDAVRLLVGWALERPEVRTVVATTEPRNGPSQRVLVRAGFERIADRGALWAYARTRGEP
ncbi:GNAT family N-acetyltransferase [Streptomyces sp. NPDC005355]|uniref:GNAT family N-acetyltransferase n=1 Tax=Streptomyces sp. NPDC005355 TaxID=3157038 RepID=UPI0033A62E77